MLPICVLNTIVFFSTLGVVEAFKRSYKVACNSANTIKSDALANHILLLRISRICKL